MSALLGPDEFSLQDKLERPEHLQGRLDALRRLYQKDRRLAREVVSCAWPHEQHRPWTSAELRQKLAALAALPGVTSVGASRIPLLAGSNWGELFGRAIGLVGNDLLLVEVGSGRIVDALYGFFY